MVKLGRPLVMSADERRNEIYVVAEKLFCEYGFENTTMTQIASEAGMSKKTLYVYFTDKKELLKSLVSSSYIWSDNFDSMESLDPIQVLKNRLRVCAEHVLSQRHIKLCRLAISESIGIDGLTQTFYENGISASRNYLIQAIEKICSSEFVLELKSEVIADMLFGASITKPFIDVLMMNSEVNFQEIFEKIDLTVDALFSKTQ